MSNPMSFKALAGKLEKATALTLLLPVDTNKERFQKQLSQAKHRLGVEGKLSFEWLEVDGEQEVSIVLHPALNAVVTGRIKEAL